MRWLIDSDILIEGERQHSDFVPWLESADEVATADVIRCEFLLGVQASVWTTAEAASGVRWRLAACERTK